VRGVDAQLAGDRPLALRSFLAARDRSPRTIAARYFLADYYLKSGQVDAGLAEISTLARLVPQSIPDVTPYLAAFARSPGAAPRVGELLRQFPQVEPALLEALSTDPQNANLILSLWSGRRGEQEGVWQGRLLAQMVEAGHFDLARATWARFTGAVSRPDQIFDPEFAGERLAPFGWNLASGPAGVADPEGEGRLNVLFYGRDDLVLASQMLTLKPGRYRLSMRVVASALPANSLQWTVRCLRTSGGVARLPIANAQSISTSFAVPRTNCPAQQVELKGTAQEFPQLTDVTISQFQLGPEVMR
jgi:hypothetical protein